MIKRMFSTRVGRSGALSGNVVVDDVFVRRSILVACLRETIFGDDVLSFGDREGRRDLQETYWTRRYSQFGREGLRDFARPVLHGVFFRRSRVAARIAGNAPAGTFPVSAAGRSGANFAETALREERFPDSRLRGAARFSAKKTLLVPWSWGEACAPKNVRLAKMAFLFLVADGKWRDFSGSRSSAGRVFIYFGGRARWGAF